MRKVSKRLGVVQNVEFSGSQVADSDLESLVLSLRRIQPGGTVSTLAGVLRSWSLQLAHAAVKIGGLYGYVYRPSRGNCARMVLL
jgi:hypothetical protein